MSLKPTKLKRVKYKSGNCYKDCFDIVSLNQTERSIRLVHGYPRLTSGNHKGQRYGHAWVEIKSPIGIWLVIDHKFQQTPFNRQSYYTIGNVQEDQLTRYTPKQAAKLSLKLNHSGPFNKIPVGVRFLSVDNVAYKSTETGFKKVQERKRKVKQK